MPDVKKGRPPLPEGVAKTTRQVVSCSENEKAWFKKQAKKKGLTPGVYARSILFKGYPG